MSKKELTLSVKCGLIFLYIVAVEMTSRLRVPPLRFISVSQCKGKTMYTTTTIKHHTTDFLDSLTRESGRCYSKVGSLVRKTHAKKGFWLSKGSVQKYLRHRGYALHSQTVQACTDSYFDALSSYFEVRKVNPDAKPPKRTPRHFKVRWKSGALRLKDGQLILSNGRGRAPVVLAMPEEVETKPRYVEMYFHRGSYYFGLVHKVAVPPKKETGIAVVSVDMGEIHLPDCLSRWRKHDYL